jgi:hypothetical protein
MTAIEAQWRIKRHHAEVVRKTANRGKSGADFQPLNCPQTAPLLQNK